MKEYTVNVDENKKKIIQELTKIKRSGMSELIN
jgi:hypothetical protein